MLQGFLGRRARQAVVRGVVRGVVWVVGGGRGCRVWGLVIGFPFMAAGAGTRGVVCRRGLGLAGVGGGLHVVRQWPGPGGGQGGMV